MFTCGTIHAQACLYSDPEDERGSQAGCLSGLEAKSALQLLYSICEAVKPEISREFSREAFQTPTVAGDLRSVEQVSSLLSLGGQAWRSGAVAVGTRSTSRRAGRAPASIEFDPCA
jgi:hypothetical protein